MHFVVYLVSFQCGFDFFYYLAVYTVNIVDRHIDAFQNIIVFVGNVVGE